jgi:hypothetical protein
MKEKSCLFTLYDLPRMPEEKNLWEPKPTPILTTTQTKDSKSLSLREPEPTQISA